MTAAELAEAIGRHEAALEPASREAVELLLARLSVHYWQPDRPAEHWDILIDDYLADLCGFPLDLVAWAIADFRRHGGDFFPRVSALVGRIEPKQAARQHALRDLREILAQRRAADPARTDADRAAGLEAFDTMRETLDGPAPIGGVADRIRRRASE